MDVDTRLLRYFAAVAQEGTLTRAAQRLFVSQPALTKQIKQLEAHLGVQLFVRSRAGMALTEPGQALAHRVPGLLADWDDGVRETRRAASHAVRLLRVGFVATAANESTQRIIAEFAGRRPGWRVDMRKTPWSDPTAGLADGQVDAAFQQLWDEPFVAGPLESGWVRGHWLASDERGGRETRIGAVARNADEWLTAIANGYGIALAPEGVARFYTRPGITYRPVTGVSPSQVGIVWAPASDANPIIQDFVQCCLDNRSPQHQSSGQRQAGRSAGEHGIHHDLEAEAAGVEAEHGLDVVDDVAHDHSVGHGDVLSGE